MIFGICYLAMFTGLSFMSILLLLPSSYQAVMPPDIKILAIVFGGALLIAPMIYLHLRAKKTTVDHILEPRSRGTHNWLYCTSDDELMFTPGIRDVEKSSYSPEINAQIQDVQSYIMGDHIVKIVKEGLGHGQDLDIAVYASVLKSKWGFESLREARETAFKKIKKFKEVPSPSYFKKLGVEKDES